jgi:hypothetical protein
MPLQEKPSRPRRSSNSLTGCPGHCASLRSSLLESPASFDSNSLFLKHQRESRPTSAADISRGLVALASTVSDTFEVFSPKLFKGMRESTAFTRHLAAQGLKVKLRTDTAIGRQ